jgi:hypothetical protein
MDERYGKAESQKIQDTQWIEEAALAGDILLCKDLAIARNTLEAQVVYMSSARVFGLSDASLTGPGTSSIPPRSCASRCRAMANSTAAPRARATDRRSGHRI